MDMESEDTMRFGGAHGCNLRGNLKEKELFEARHEISKQAKVWEATMRIERGEQKWSMEVMIPSKLNTAHQKYVDLPLFFELLS
jgi:hypothetical protein